LLNQGAICNQQVAASVLLGEDPHHIAHILEAVDLVKRSSNSMYCIDNGLYNEIISVYEKPTELRSTNIRQVVFWYLTKLIGPVQENADKIMFVNGIRYYYVVENMADIHRGFDLFFKLRVELKDTNKIYTMAFIGPFGSIFVNNILYLDSNKRRNLKNVWDIINKFFVQEEQKRSKSKSINKTTKTNFRNYIDGIFKQEYDYIKFYFYFKTWIQRYTHNSDVIRWIWHTLLTEQPNLKNIALMVF